MDKLDLILQKLSVLDEIKQEALKAKSAMEASIKVIKALTTECSKDKTGH